jgi:uncharacterized membrane protein YbhN (UPF0104 family)
VLPNDHKPWAKTVARIVVCSAIVALAVLAYFLNLHNNLRIPEVVGIILLFLAIVPPNLAIIYPWLLPDKNTPHHSPKSTTR